MPALLPPPHFFLFAFQFVLDAAEVVAELFLEFVHGIGVALGLRFGDFAAEEKFALGFFGFVERVELREFCFFCGAEFGGGFLLLQAFHGEFVGAFHFGLRLLAESGVSPTLLRTTQAARAHFQHSIDNT